MSENKPIGGRLLRENPAATQHQEHSEVLFLTSSFMFKNAAEAAGKFAEHGSDYVYSRFSNPTVNTLNRRIALLEGAERALSTASGMAAILTVVMGVCGQGARVLCGADVFGAIISLLSKHLTRFGVSVEYIYGTDLDAWREKSADGADLFLVETPSNPMQEVTDLAALADIAHRAGAVLAVDNCFAAGLQHPLALGADLVVHSGTKYLDGQGRVLGGIVAGGEELLMSKLYPFLRAAGPCMSPFNAWVLLKGLETLALRTEAHSRNALQVAEWLAARDEVRMVRHTALPTHPAHALAMRQQGGRGGGLLTIALRAKDDDAARRDTAWRFIDALTKFSITANFGDAKSIVTHPASTTHYSVPKDMRDAIGVTEDIVRLSIGLEPPEELIEDLAQAFAETRRVSAS